LTTGADGLRQREPGPFIELEVLSPHVRLKWPVDPLELISTLGQAIRALLEPEM
jgi:hypothetical protein